MPWGVHTIKDVIAPPDMQVQLEEYHWVRSVLSPYPANLFQRARAAWFVFTGQAHAIKWPTPLELSKVLSR